jgi:transposase
MLNSLRTDPATKDKDIVLFMDNAKFHHHSEVLKTCQKMKVTVLFNAEYSPWLNPVELFFGYVKREIGK